MYILFNVLQCLYFFFWFCSGTAQDNAKTRENNVQTLKAKASHPKSSRSIKTRMDKCEKVLAPFEPNSYYCYASICWPKSVCVSAVHLLPAIKMWSTDLI